MPDLDLQIGIENELILQVPNRPPPPNLEEDDVKIITLILVLFYNTNIPKGQILLDADFSKESHPGRSYDGPNSKGQWAVTHDNSVGPIALGNGSKDVEGWPLEFVSPILYFCPGSIWRKQVADHWSRISLVGKPYINESCATHVHVSPKSGAGWILDQLKRFAKALLYFDKAFEAIYAPSRRGHPFSRSNKANHKLVNLSFEECCKGIEACVSPNDLVFFMQSEPFVFQEGDPAQYYGDRTRREYAWNLENAKEGGSGTIEFRCAPGVLTAGDCLVWVEFAVSFVQAAAQYGTEEFLRTKEDDIKGLREFIGKAEVKDMNNSKLLDIATHDHSGSRASMKKDEELRAVFTEELKKISL